MYRGKILCAALTESSFHILLILQYKYECWSQFEITSSSSSSEIGSLHVSCWDDELAVSKFSDMWQHVGPLRPHFVVTWKRLSSGQSHYHVQQLVFCVCMWHDYGLSIQNRYRTCPRFLTCRL
jgi:hypothetical protein